MDHPAIGTKPHGRVYIGVMGPTGVGKSTFINLASGSNLRVGEGLESCTDDVHVSSVFNLYGRRVTLLDTPGFDDTNKSDTEILAVITSFLEESYRKGIKLAGIVYIHRISDFRMGGSSTRNFKLFCNICGDDALKNCVIVTNMWGEVDAKKGAKREGELRDKFFKVAIDKGAKMVRHDNTVETAHKILQDMIRNRPLPLRIQVELVEEKKGLLETIAGAELNREMLEVTRKQEAEMRQLQEEMSEALRLKDEVTRQELEEARQELQEKMDNMKHDAENLESARIKQKPIQTQRARNLANDASQDEQAKVSKEQTPHANRAAQGFGTPSQKEPRGKEIKPILPQQRRVQTTEFSESIHVPQPERDSIITVPLEEFKAMQKLLNSVRNDQAALERRVLQLEEDRDKAERRYQRAKDDKHLSCVVQ